jgi:hypothetical protein
MMFAKPITFFAIAMMALGACKPKQPSEEVLEFVKEFDGKSLAEAREILHTENERVDNFIDFMKHFGEEKTKSFKPEEEEFAAPYKPKAAEELAAKHAAWFEGVGFRQLLEYPNSAVGADGDFRHSNSDIDAPDLFTAKIFFHDGSTDEKKYAMDGSTKIPTVKTMDSILVDASYSYPTKVVMLTLDKQHDKVTYKGAEIKIDKMGDNRVRLLMGDKAYHDFMHIDALNKDGKPLDYTGTNSGANSPDDMRKLLGDFSKTLKSLISKLDKGRFKDVAALQQEIKAQMPDGSPFDEGRDGYTEGYFKGNVAKVNVYLAENVHKEKKQLTLKNLDPNYSGLFMTKDDKSGNYGFKDGSGQFVIPATYKKLSPINPYFFASEDYNGYYYYRLDTATKKLLKLDYEVKELTSQLVTVAKPGATNGTGVMDGNGNMIVPATYEGVYLDATESVLYANKSEEDGPLQGITTLYDYRGQLLSPDAYYTSGATYHNGLLLVMDKAHKICFIDNKGKKAIDLKGYIDAESFSDGLARVRDAGSNNYGFINTKGQRVIPCNYTTAASFNEGISMVYKNNNDTSEVGLINVKNEPVVSFRHASSVSESGDGAKKEYAFDGKKFNAHGVEIR